MDKILEKAVSIIVNEVEPEKVLLFGSRAYGTPSNESDYDILIIKDFSGNHRRFLKKLYVKLFGIGVPIDLLLVSKINIENNLDNIYYFYKEAVKKGIILYDKNKIS
ncbi:MAG: nucleotidyltransferase domain-containing protein [Candidatus Cloacimonetes bacterium]|nr:nucleotidyltransferase domain-containing protein [Candidatus Cloacimonadota bacterium]